MLQYEAHHPHAGSHQDDRDRHGHEQSKLFGTPEHRTTYHLAPGTGPHYLDTDTDEDSYALPRGMLLMMMMKLVSGQSTSLIRQGFHLTGLSSQSFGKY